MYDFMGEFCIAMRSAGIATKADIIADGMVRRFHVEGDRPGSKNGWYILHIDDAPYGEFSTWKRIGEKPEKWYSGKQKTLTEDKD